MKWIVVFFVLTALAAERTLLHTIGLALDDLLATVGANRVGCLTLSSYAGKWARHGRAWASLAIGFLFLSWPPMAKWFKGPWRDYLLQHGEGAMVADVGRACDSLEVLLANDAHAVALIAALRQRSPNP